MTGDLRYAWGRRLSWIQIKDGVETPFGWIRKFRPEYCPTQTEFIVGYSTAVQPTGYINVIIGLHYLYSVDQHGQVVQAWERVGNIWRITQDSLVYFLYLNSSESFGNGFCWLISIQIVGDCGCGAVRHLSSDHGGGLISVLVRFKVTIRPWIRPNVRNKRHTCRPIFHGRNSLYKHHHDRESWKWVLPPT